MILPRRGLGFVVVYAAILMLFQGCRRPVDEPDKKTKPRRSTKARSSEPVVGESIVLPHGDADLAKALEESDPTYCPRRPVKDIYRDDYNDYIRRGVGANCCFYDYARISKDSSACELIHPNSGFYAPCVYRSLNRKHKSDALEAICRGILLRGFKSDHFVRCIREIAKLRAPKKVCEELLASDPSLLKKCRSPDESWWLPSPAGGRVAPDPHLHKNATWILPSPRHRLVYIGYGAGKLLAVDHERGTLRWEYPKRFPVRNIVGSSAQPRPPVIEGNVLRVTGPEGISELDAFSGTIIRNYDLIHNSRIYVAQKKHRNERTSTFALRAYDANRKYLWKTRVPGDFHSINGFDDAILVSSITTGRERRRLRLSTLQSATGKTLWHTEIDGVYDARVFRHKAIAIVNTEFGKLYGFAMDKGVQIWMRQMREEGLSDCLFSPEGFICSQDNGLTHMLDPNSGETKLKIVGGKGTRPLLITRDRLLILSAANTPYIVSINPDSGRVQWRLPAPLGVCGKPVIGLERLHFGTDEGWFLAVDLKSGKVRHSVRIPVKCEGVTLYKGDYFTFVNGVIQKVSAIPQ